jgi:hypothetical protein
MANLAQYRDWLFGLYDGAFADRLLGKIKHTDRTTNNDGSVSTKIWVIPKCFATPDRAHAQIAKVMKKSSGQNVPQTKVDAVPFPFISLSRIGHEYDAYRHQYADRRYASLVLADGTHTTDPAIVDQWCKGEIEAKGIGRSRWPLPVNIQYQVDFWSRNLRHHDSFRVQLYRLFYHGVHYLSVPFNSPFGERIIGTFLESLVDNSNIEPGEDQRDLRWAATITVKGWIPDEIEHMFTIPFVKQICIDWRLRYDLDLPTNEAVEQQIIE